MKKIISEVLKSQVSQDAITKKVSGFYDFEWTGESTFTTASFELPKDFGTLLIVGPSGSGKSSLSKQFGEEEVIKWDNSKAVVSQFEDYTDAEERLNAVALSSIPSWLSPYGVLSTGQKFRADLARKLKSGAVIDEYTSVIDRSTALSCSTAISKYISKKNLKGITFISCHYDIIPFLNCDYVFDTKTNRLLSKEAARQIWIKPEIKLEVEKSERQAWSLFSPHHYLTASLPKPCHNWVYYWNGNPVGFAALLYFPHPSPKISPMYKISRLVVLPDYQGMGFGSKIMKHIAQTATGHFSYNEKQGKTLRNKCSIRTTLPKLVSYLHYSKDWEFKVGSDKITKKRDLDTKVKGSVDTKRLADPKYLNKYAGRPASTFSYVGNPGVFETKKEIKCQSQSTFGF